MKEQPEIPVSKVKRASRILRTGAKVSGNYVKHYSKKILNPDLDKSELHQDNAADIYKSLSELKGSALKVAQMISMEKNLLPRAYSDQFSLSQYNVPPLSYPLVVRSFQRHFKKGPTEIFDEFSPQAVHAASIGQVHKATWQGKKLAVKVQYPGVADSVSSDLKMVKPLAIRLLGLKNEDLSRYFKEVEERLLEETNYTLELDHCEEISASCQGLSGLCFPSCYRELSSARILTMDWLEGQHLKDFLATNPSAEIRNRIGQTLWDFYNYQVHKLQVVHADPHPGNFLIQEDGTVGVLDFGCVKVIPKEFYDHYFHLLNKDVTDSEEKTIAVFLALDLLMETDSPEQQRIVLDVFSKMARVLSRPFHHDSFDFSKKDYFDEIFRLSEEFNNLKKLRQINIARGSQHGIYINRTYFGLYSLLHELKAEIEIKKTREMIFEDFN